MPRTMLTILVLVAGLLAGCGDDDGDGGSTGSTPSAQPSSPASSAPSGDGDTDGDTGGDTDGDGKAQPPFSANTEPDGQQASADAFGNVTTIRIGHHDGFDRVVLEYAGPGMPGWDVRYVDQPTRQGSGEPVDLPGDAALQVAVRGVGYPPDTGIAEYSGPQRVSAAGTTAVTEVFFDGTFEGITAVVVGTETRTPFRVDSLTDPIRIVLEVAEAG
ncbi:hypothetical protein [Blastococcus sp. URHD0036]|uniref:AMIN-like domain-containing (lipo)protein n=1 Tax=Blastococcus sp. URHD0036 TaxID=1380356 RepID=UPI00049622D6|nr:hypothetical protein [Blastococcus sp. URHD0036]